MEANKVQTVKKGRFSDRVVDAHHREIGFVHKGYIYKLLDDDKKQGTAWFRMQKTGEKGKDKRKYLLFSIGDTEPCAFVDSNNDVYDINNENYLFSIERSRPLIILLLLFIGLVIATLLAIFFAGDILLQTAFWSPDIETIDISITDDDQEWSKSEVTDLDIFGFNKEVIDENGNVKVVRTEKKIYPGLTGEYQFRIKNTSEEAIYYDTEFTDVNEYDVPMRFKLKLNGEYVAGSKDEWVTISGLKVATQKLSPERKDLYTLEWIWYEMDDAHDTKLGEEAIAKYVFNINVRCRPIY